MVKDISTADDAKVSSSEDVGKALAEAISHLRDVSLRDGVQSWDGNKWKIDDIVTVAKELDAFAQEVNKVQAGSYPPSEVWGGGQVNQPAKFLKEDPFDNLEKLHEAAPNLEFQVLYRGRQGYGFKPLSEDVQRDALEASIERGVKVVRIYDMMNDPENVRTGIDILKEHNKQHPDNIVTIEGTVAYISEPKDGKRAWELDDYADYAVKLAKMGAHEIAIKNFCGVADHEMPALVSKIHEQLDKNGFDSMPVNIHSHGEKVDLYAGLVADKEKGTSKVDVAVGELSGGPSHTNMRTLIHKMLDDKIDAKQIDEHPIMQQLAKVESSIHEVVHRTNEKGESFDSTRGALKNLKREDIEKYRVAGGAFADVWARASAMVDAEVNARDARIQAKEKAQKSGNWMDRDTPSVALKPINLEEAEAKKQETFYKMLDMMPEVWEKAGRFNTVTPGSKILVDQVSIIAVKKFSHSNATILMTDYIPEYLDVATGRYGENKGMEKGIGDKKFENAALMFRALKAINHAVETGEISGADVQYLKGDRDLVQKDGGKIEFKLNDPALEKKLGETDRLAFAKDVERILPSSVVPKILKELQSGRSDTPVKTTDEMAAEIFQRLNVNPKDYEDMPNISAKTLPILASLTHDVQKGRSDDSVLRDLLAHHKALQPKTETHAAGETELPELAQSVPNR